MMVCQERTAPATVTTNTKKCIRCTQRTVPANVTTDTENATAVHCTYSLRNLHSPNPPIPTSVFLRWSNGKKRECLVILTCLLCRHGISHIPRETNHETARSAGQPCAMVPRLGWANQ